MDIASDRKRRGKPGDEFPVEGTGEPADDDRAGEVREADARAAVDETTPANRAGWKASLDADDRPS